MLHLNSLDYWHILVTGLLYFAGVVSILYTLPKVRPIRRIIYYLALPIWLGWVYLYGEAILTFEPRVDSFHWGEIVLRVLLFAIAIEGVLVPYVDRLEQAGGTEIRVVQE